MRIITDEEMLDNLNRVIEVFEALPCAGENADIETAKYMGTAVGLWVRHMFRRGRPETFEERNKRLAREQRKARREELAEVEAERVRNNRAELATGQNDEIKLPKWTEFLLRLSEKAVERQERKAAERRKPPQDVKAEILPPADTTPERVEGQPAPAIEGAAEVKESTTEKDYDEEEYDGQEE